MLCLDGETMNIDTITRAIERYFNGETEEFEWTLIEEECKNSKKYYCFTLKKIRYMV